jgi:hypothetical protein
VNQFFIALFAASQLIYNVNPPRHDYFGKIICSESGCKDFRKVNGLWVVFTGVKYSYRGKKSTVKVFCSFTNNTNDTLLFNRRSLSISSDTSEYILQPRVGWERGVFKEIPDTILRIEPWPYGKDVHYSFEFTSKNKMSRKLMGSDTLRFQYSGGEQTTTLFRIALLKEDPNWTREEVMRALEN